MTSTATVIPRDMTHAVIYRGAPYGLNEGGHIVSCHRSREAAEKAAGPFARYNDLHVVALDEPYPCAFEGRTARQHFGAPYGG